ncbi:hypothetical protein Trco_003509 [Trichoderma cornu-damae]|uniref:2EXR domain-containing protein n=1 Tax=Trichoderma cornu-damae TaxID=654480 RepID=A0A9P8QIU8_9HYPO|nr:hypothetical protein Trco_003509 [Trichoderma cornu-damae]
MATLTETKFTCFQKLPKAIRVKIWELVPEPERLVGWIPCVNCLSISSLPEKNRQDEDNHLLERKRCMNENHPNWIVKYVVQPRKDVIFAPLHACRESRKVWLPKYVRPPRHMFVESSDILIPVQFSVPFISYKSDTFTMFGAWSAGTAFDIGHRMEAPIEPFIGLDRGLIQKAGYCEILDLFLPASTLFDLNELPALKKLSLIALGPRGPAPTPQSFQPIYDVKSLVQMNPFHAQDYDCQIIDLVSPEAGENSIILNELRPRRPPVDWFPESLKPFDGYYGYWKAWLWHVVKANANSMVKQNARCWWMIVNFVFADNSNHTRTPEDCPLFPDRCINWMSHKRSDIDNWEPRFEISCKLLCEEQWVTVLRNHVGVKVEGWKHPIDREAKYQEDERFHAFMGRNFTKSVEWWDIEMGKTR